MNPLEKIEINIGSPDPMKKKKVLMATLLGPREIEVDQQGNNEDLQLHVNLEKLEAIDKTLKTIEEHWKGH